jgi:hypothetical protein
MSKHSQETYNYLRNLILIWLQQPRQALDCLLRQVPTWGGALATFLQLLGRIPALRVGIKQELAQGCCSPTLQLTVLHLADAGSQCLGNTCTRRRFDADWA